MEDFQRQALEKYGKRLSDISEKYDAYIQRILQYFSGAQEIEINKHEVYKATIYSLMDTGDPEKDKLKSAAVYFEQRFSEALDVAISTERILARSENFNDAKEQLNNVTEAVDETIGKIESYAKDHKLSDEQKEDSKYEDWLNMLAEIKTATSFFIKELEAEKSKDVGGRS